jgi:hypothetical protein
VCVGCVVSVGVYVGCVCLCARVLVVCVGRERVLVACLCACVFVCLCVRVCLCALCVECVICLDCSFPTKMIRKRGRRLLFVIHCY